MFYSFVCAVCTEARIHVPMEGSGWGVCETWFPFFSSKRLYCFPGNPFRSWPVSCWGDANVAVPLDTQWVFNGFLHGQSPKTAGKPSCGLEAFPEDLCLLQLAARVFGVAFSVCPAAMERWVWCVWRKAGSDAAKTYGQSTWLLFFLCRNGGVQLGCHPERLHHCPVRLRPDRPDLCQTACHEAETAQPEDIQPAVKQHFWKGVLLFLILDSLLALLQGAFSFGCCFPLLVRVILEEFWKCWPEQLVSPSLSSVLPGNSEAVLRFLLRSMQHLLPKPLSSFIFIFKIWPFGLRFLVFGLGQEAISSVLVVRSFLIKNWLYLWATQMGIWKLFFTKQGIFQKFFFQ